MPSFVEQESSENYLETIYFLYKIKESVRSIDIAKEVNHSRASVSRALSILKDRNLVVVDVNGVINLTDEGLKYAEHIASVHDMLSKFLKLTLHLDDEQLENNACRMEHVLSKETIEAIELYINKNNSDNLENNNFTSHFPNQADLNESSEHYLETIYLLGGYDRLGYTESSFVDIDEQYPVASQCPIKSIDIATKLELSRASVSRAINNLKEKGFIFLNEKKLICLTKKGFVKAVNVYSRHVQLTKFLMNTINLGHDIAVKDACRIEHLISDECFLGILNYNKKFLDN